MKLSLAQTVAYRLRTPEEKQAVFKILEKYGYKVSNDPDAIAQKLNAIILNSGEPGLLDVLSVHPDREAILDNGRAHHNANGQHMHMESNGGYHNCCGMHHANGNGGGFHNCSGCNGSCGGNMHNAGGGNNLPQQQPTAQNMAQNHFPTVAIFGIVTIFGLAALMTMKKG